MSEKKGYECSKCGKKEIVEDGSIPDCCNQSMKQVPLDVCMKAPADAEHARSADNDDACDDFRGE